MRTHPSYIPQQCSRAQYGSCRRSFMPEFAFSVESEVSDVNVLGPKKGYSPQIGTLVSMMTWMRQVILMPVKGMTQKDLDFLLDDKANRIGALLLHLAATDRLYHVHTFQNVALKDCRSHSKRSGACPWNSVNLPARASWPRPRLLSQHPQ